ncbi:helix-turn-helix domain-containing protein [Streptomyces aureoverticillatus]|uniref:helix-turn-helix domain-containing protein n=1 Tax=Streptomyces aureoverticillatus TaxID=66871 RepID=UPI001EF81FC1|nr:helix-turn-helix transcriptional regulator [Streptomyces aureoverticillatus]
METPRLPVGERVRYYRRKNGNRKQAAVAGLCGITERYLSQIENGHKVPSPEVLARLASELGVPVAALLSDEVPQQTPSAPLTSSPDIVRALMGHQADRSSVPANPVSPADLRERVEAAWSSWQSSPIRFTDAESVLPALIADTEHAVRAHQPPGEAAVRREALRAAADLYGLLRSYCRRTGRNDLSLLVADRAMRAAEDADDPIRVAAAQWNLGHVLLSTDRADAAAEAAETAAHGIARLDSVSPGPEAAALKGALELVSVVAEARQQRWWQARERLRERAGPMAELAGESNRQWTVFGPTNVTLHAMSVEMLAGGAAEALRLADAIDTSSLPSCERAFTFRLEVAECYGQRREDAAVLVHLRDLEVLAPEDMARSPLAHNLIVRLLHRVRPMYRQQVAQLAERLGIAA